MLARGFEHHPRLLDDHVLAGKIPSATSTKRPPRDQAVLAPEPHEAVVFEAFLHHWPGIPLHPSSSQGARSRPP